MNNHYKYLLIITLLFAAAGCSKLQDIPATASDIQESDEAAPVTCGKHTLSADDASKWDCVPSRGFLCTDLNGCPVHGNTAPVGMHLDYVTWMPEAKGYVLVGKLYSYVHTDGFSEFSERLGWKCTLDEGCFCGGATIVKDGECYDDSYSAQDALTGNCNKDNCNAYCKNDKCVCGDVPSIMGVYEETSCTFEQ